MLNESRINLIVEEACKKYKIPYKNNYKTKYSQVVRDSQMLGEIFLQLKLIAKELEEIGNRHDIDGLGKLLLDDLDEILDVEHDVATVAKAIIKRKK